MDFNVDHLGILIDKYIAPVFKRVVKGTFIPSSISIPHVVSEKMLEILATQKAYLVLAVILDTQMKRKPFKMLRVS